MWKGGRWAAIGDLIHLVAARSFPAGEPLLRTTSCTLCSASAMSGGRIDQPPSRGYIRAPGLAPGPDSGLGSTPPGLLFKAPSGATLFVNVRLVSTASLLSRRGVRLTASSRGSRASRLASLTANHSRGLKIKRKNTRHSISI